ncbi:Hypothetical protein NTJ_13214 [Nesidiocoris tenuis]|nr:Hypothetical protein NTJ_13214 [Nesidiocoris tenuis]
MSPDLGQNPASESSDLHPEHDSTQFDECRHQRPTGDDGQSADETTTRTATECKKGGESSDSGKESGDEDNKMDDGDDEDEDDYEGEDEEDYEVTFLVWCFEQFIGTFFTTRTTNTSSFSPASCVFSTNCTFYLFYLSYLFRIVYLSDLFCIAYLSYLFCIAYLFCIVYLSYLFRIVYLFCIVYLSYLFFIVYLSYLFYIVYLPTSSASSTSLPLLHRLPLLPLLHWLPLLPLLHRLPLLPLLHRLPLLPLLHRLPPYLFCTGYLSYLFCVVYLSYLFCTGYLSYLFCVVHLSYLFCTGYLSYLFRVVYLSYLFRVVYLSYLFCTGYLSYLFRVVYLSYLFRVVYLSYLFCIVYLPTSSAPATSSTSSASPTSPTSSASSTPLPLLHRLPLLPLLHRLPLLPLLHRLPPYLFCTGYLVYLFCTGYLSYLFCTGYLSYLFCIVYLSYLFCTGYLSYLFCIVYLSYLFCIVYLSYLFCIVYLSYLFCIVYLSYLFCIVYLFSTFYLFCFFCLFHDYQDCEGFEDRGDYPWSCYLTTIEEEEEEQEDAERESKSEENQDSGNDSDLEKSELETFEMLEKLCEFETIRVEKERGRISSYHEYKRLKATSPVLSEYQNQIVIEKDVKGLKIKVKKREDEEKDQNEKCVDSKICKGNSSLDPEATSSNLRGFESKCENSVERTDTQGENTLLDRRDTLKEHNTLEERQDTLEEQDPSEERQDTLKERQDTLKSHQDTRKEQNSSEERQGTIEERCASLSKYTVDVDQETLDKYGNTLYEQHQDTLEEQQQVLDELQDTLDEDGDKSRKSILTFRFPSGFDESRLDTNRYEDVSMENTLDAFVDTVQGDELDKSDDRIRCEYDDDTFLVSDDTYGEYIDTKAEYADSDTESILEVRVPHDFDDTKIPSTWLVHKDDLRTTSAIPVASHGNGGPAESISAYDLRSAASAARRINTDRPTGRRPVAAELAMKHDPDPKIKSALKRGASSKKRKKHKVQFDESLNKFFEADYVILIREECGGGGCDCGGGGGDYCYGADDDDDDLPMAPSAPTMAALDLAPFEPPSEFVDQLTLSPPDGYKDHHCLHHQPPVQADDENRERWPPEEPKCEDGQTQTTPTSETEDNDGPLSLTEVQEKKERYIVETITMTTVTERRIIREAEAEMEGAGAFTKAAAADVTATTTTTTKDKEMTLTFKLGSNSLKPNSALRQLFPRIASPPPDKSPDSDDDSLQSNLIKRTIERNTLRRSLVRYPDIRKRNQAKKNENSLVERIKKLTCDIDDDDLSTTPSTRGSPTGEESKDSFGSMHDSSTALVESSKVPAYRKITDIFIRNREPHPVVLQTPASVEHQYPYYHQPYNPPDLGNGLPKTRQSHDARKQFLSSLAPLAACVSSSIDDAPGSRESTSTVDTDYSLGDIDDVLKDQKPQPDIVVGTPGNESDELALFVQQDASRIERLRKRYSSAGGSDDEQDDYGFNRRPSVRGIKPRFGSTTEILQQMQSQIAPPLPSGSHVSWPYYPTDERNGYRRYVEEPHYSQNVIHVQKGQSVRLPYQAGPVQVHLMGGQQSRQVVVRGTQTISTYYHIPRAGPEQFPRGPLVYYPSSPVCGSPTKMKLERGVPEGASASPHQEQSLGNVGGALMPPPPPLANPGPIPQGPLPPGPPVPAHAQTLPLGEPPMMYAMNV